MAGNTCEKCLVLGVGCKEEKNGRFWRIVFNAAETQRTVTIDGKKAFSTSIPINECQVIKGEKTSESVVKEIRAYKDYQSSQEMLRGEEG